MDSSATASATGMSDLINATKGQALNTGALVQSNQNLVTQTTNLVTAFNTLSTSINNAISLGPWTTWSPTVTSGTGSITSFGTIVARYIAMGKTVFFSLTIPITNNGTGATFVQSTLPLTARSNAYGSGREIQSAGTILTFAISASSNTVDIFTNANAYPGGTGFTVAISGTYEAQ